MGLIAWRSAPHPHNNLQIRISQTNRLKCIRGRSPEQPFLFRNLAPDSRRGKASKTPHFPSRETHHQEALNSGFERRNIISGASRKGRLPNKSPIRSRPGDQSDGVTRRTPEPEKTDCSIWQPGLGTAKAVITSKAAAVHASTLSAPLGVSG